jgi:hypothetical protein
MNRSVVLFFTDDLSPIGHGGIPPTEMGVHGSVCLEKVPTISVMSGLSLVTKGVVLVEFGRLVE